MLNWVEYDQRKEVPQTGRLQTQKIVHRIKSRHAGTNGCKALRFDKAFKIKKALKSVGRFSIRWADKTFRIYSEFECIRNLKAI